MAATKTVETKEFKKVTMEYIIETFGLDFAISIFGEQYVSDVLALRDTKLLNSPDRDKIPIK